jgi:hypothetical protein
VNDAVGAKHVADGLALGEGLDDGPGEPDGVGVGEGVGVGVGVGEGEGVEATPPLGAVAIWAVAVEVNVTLGPPMKVDISGVSSVK